ncbi:uncharacterized protein LOC115212164 [Octopus sinensis]|uniref:Uncharacterized protein LOC115212164 n=1 Tax=Octopus sinensis TaxID=2607531 RepID=A0A6P7SFY2_9MOLL|nr:uncharacterized protein LOC115212164 [Octopus sinensis]
MVDTGSCCSIWPLRLTGDKPKRSSIVLHAIDSSPIATFGQVSLRLDIHLRRDFQWVFVVADFLNNFNLLLDVKRWRLLEGTTSLSPPTRGSTNAVLSSTFFVATSGNGFHSLLTPFPELVDITFQPAKPAHSILHFITTTGPPVFSRSRRLVPDRLKTARAEFEHMLQLGLIRPSTIPWASPLQLARKGESDFRPVGDYRRFNADRYPIWNLIFRTFKRIFYGCINFSKVDLIRAYHQIPVNPADVPKTAITTPFGCLEFLYMSFGLRNATSTFERFIDEVVRGLDLCLLMLMKYSLRATPVKITGTCLSSFSVFAPIVYALIPTSVFSDNLL